MSEVRGVGIDLCEIARMEDERTKTLLLRRCCTERERAYIASKGAAGAQTMAGIWAAKEAALKALGTGLTLPMTEIEVAHGELGAPEIVLHGKAAELCAGGRFAVSITHEGGMAAAVCVYSTVTSG